MPAVHPPLQWDIFCRVIDNFGDIGVCWRLAADLASRGQQVRLWLDDASALAWMAPGGCAGVALLDWTAPLAESDLALLEERPCQVLIESFGCAVAPEFIAACAHIYWARGTKALWINLEYLSAEPYVARCHGLPSPVANGPAAGWTKWFFYPGFTAATGGLLREPDLAARQAEFDRSGWLVDQGIELPEVSGELLISLFCYEPPALAALLQQLAARGLNGEAVRLLVAAGRPDRAVRTALAQLKSQNMRQIGSLPNQNGREMLSISYLPWLTQIDYDHVLWASDLNFVRGEDSVVRALWAGKPFVWQIYPQDDGAHQPKLDAFLDMLGAPSSLREVHYQWNGMHPSERLNLDLAAWQAHFSNVQDSLLGQHDLSSSLLQWVEKNR